MNVNLGFSRKVREQIVFGFTAGAEKELMNLSGRK